MSNSSPVYGDTRSVPLVDHQAGDAVERVWCMRADALMVRYSRLASAHDRALTQTVADVPQERVRMLKIELEELEVAIAQHFSMLFKYAHTGTET